MPIYQIAISHKLRQTRIELLLIEDDTQVLPTLRERVKARPYGSFERTLLTSGHTLTVRKTTAGITHTFLTPNGFDKAQNAD